MSITPLEYVKKEFDDTDKLSPEDWLRKMQEFSVLQNSKIDLEYIVELIHNKDKSKINALNQAVSALYFSDSKDYKNALFGVVKELSKINYDVLDDEVIKSLFYLLNPVS